MSANHAPEPQLPFDDIITYILFRFPPDESPIYNERLRRWEPTNNRVADLVGQTMPMIQRWRLRNWVRLSEGDKIACTLGVHPTRIWPDAYTHAELHPYRMLEPRQRTRVLAALKHRGICVGKSPDFDEQLEDECWRMLDVLDDVHLDEEAIAS